MFYSLLVRKVYLFLYAKEPIFQFHLFQKSSSYWDNYAYYSNLFFPLRNKLLEQSRKDSPFSSSVSEEKLKTVKKWYRSIQQPNWRMPPHFVQVAQEEKLEKKIIFKSASANKLKQTEDWCQHVAMLRGHILLWLKKSVKHIFEKKFLFFSLVFSKICTLKDFIWRIHFSHSIMNWWSSNLEDLFYIRCTLYFNTSINMSFCILRGNYLIK